MTEVPLEDRIRLLSDKGPGYVSRAFAATWAYKDPSHPGSALLLFRDASHYDEQVVHP